MFRRIIKICSKGSIRLLVLIDGKPMRTSILLIM